MIMLYILAAALPAAWLARLRLAAGVPAERSATTTEQTVLAGLITLAIVGFVLVVGGAVNG